MKYKIIEVYQENKIECDKCEFVIKNYHPNTLSIIDEYINTTCPDCGSNLLTVHDYNDYMALCGAINWVNKYFGWLSVFFKNERVIKVSIRELNKTHKKTTLN